MGLPSLVVGRPAQVVVGRGEGELITGGDIAPDGTRVVLRTYESAYEWTIVGGDVPEAFRREPKLVELPAQPQGEAIAFTNDGDLVVTSEDPFGTHPPVYRVRRP